MLNLLADTSVTISNEEILKGLGAVGAGIGYGAAAIGPGLARAALAVRVDGELRDLGRPLPDGAGPHQLEIVTERSGEESNS